MQEQSIESQLSFAEDVLLKLKAQTEQEMAMAEVLPVRFQENLSAFEKLIPSIADFFKDYKPTKSFEFFCTDNGIPNFYWVDDKTPFYNADPYVQCQEQIKCFIKECGIARFHFGVEDNSANQIHVKYLNELSGLYFDFQNKFQLNEGIQNGVPLFLMFGVGLGYQLGYLFEEVKPKNTFIFEPDLDVFYASLYAFDWKSLIEYFISEKLGLHIFLGQNKDSLMSDMLAALTKRGEFLTANMAALCHYSSEKTIDLVETVLKEIYLLNTGWGFFDDSISALGHSAKNILNNIPFLLKDKKIKKEWRDIPVFVIANGPSLDAALPVIKEMQDKVIICACGSSIATLYNQGIKPDIYFTVERTQTSANFAKLINDEKFLHDILYLSSDVLHPDAYQYFEKIGVGFQVSEPMYPILMANCESAHQYEPLTWVNPLVGNMGLSYPILLGFRKIYLFGIDNGFKERGHHHSRFSAYYDNAGNPIEAFSGMALANGGLELPGNFDGVVIANELFATSVKMMSGLLENNKHIDCFNCGDGAFIHGAKPLKPELISFNHSSVEKKEIVDFIYDECFKPINVKKDNLVEWLSIPLFNEIVDLLINDWKKNITSRDAALEKMQQQYEYVQSLFSTRYHHIYRMLIGSLNYCFTLMSMTAYKFHNDTDAMIALQKSIEIFIKFLSDMKDMYPSALSSQDTRDDGMFHIINEIKSQ